MKFRIEVVCINDAGHEHRNDLLEIERHQLAMETLGLSLYESKAMLESLQDFVVARQTAEDLQQRRHCPNCEARDTAKGGGRITVKTLFGAVQVANPRWNRCSCRGLSRMGTKITLRNICNGISIMRGYFLLERPFFSDLCWKNAPHALARQVVSSPGSQAN